MNSHVLRASSYWNLPDLLFILMVHRMTMKSLLPVHTRAAEVVVILLTIDTLLVLGAAFALYGKLRRTDDIYNMSREIQLVGALALLATGK